MHCKRGNSVTHTPCDFSDTTRKSAGIDAKNLPTTLTTRSSLRGLGVRGLINFKAALGQISDAVCPGERQLGGQTSNCLALCGQVLMWPSVMWPSVKRRSARRRIEGSRNSSFAGYFAPAPASIMRPVLSGIFRNYSFICTSLNPGRACRAPVHCHSRRIDTFTNLSGSDHVSCLSRNLSPQLA